MLEHSSLRLHGWSRVGSAWQRTVTDVQGNVLGTIRFPPVAPSWFSWFVRPRLEILETADNAHLMTMVRVWGFQRGWNVLDADEIFVGTVYPRSIISADGYEIARPQQHDIVASEKQVILLRHATNPASELEMTFSGDTMRNPFVRMLLLASVVSLDATPNQG